jgi:adenylosuccinate synthase
MPSKVIIGLQWGDEGKGKVVDNLVHQWADVCVRYQGGPNAGHTIYDVDGNKHVTHALPSGVLKKDCINIIAKGCVVEPFSLYSELMEYPTAKLSISDQCPLILPHHIIWDRFKYQGKIGTTAKGIGPAYSEYIARDNKTLFDLCYNFDEVAKYVSDKLRRMSAFDTGEHFDEIFNKYLITDKFTSQDTIDTQFMPRKLDMFLENDYLPRLKNLSYVLKEYLVNSDKQIQDLYAAQKNIVLEGAQGWGLDVWGRSYPNVTSSSPNIGGVLTATGLNHKQIDEVIGIVKIYKSKVGEGNHNTQSHFENNIAYESVQELREALGEFGATTGRPRRLGWLNLDEVKEACQTNGVDRIVITRIDSIKEIMNPYDAFSVYFDSKYLHYMTWNTQNLCNSEEEFLQQPELLFFIEDVKRITGVQQISLSYGPRRNQLQW